VEYGSREGSGSGPDGAPVLPAGDAITGAEVVLFVGPGGAVAACGSALNGKVVIDAANRIGEPNANSHAAIAAAAPQCRYVRAFNTLGWRTSPTRRRSAAMFFAADPGARPTAEEFITAVGLEPVFAGTSATVDACFPCGSYRPGTTRGNRRVAHHAIAGPRGGISPDTNQPAEDDLPAVAAFSARRGPHKYAATHAIQPRMPLTAGTLTT
jgi:8-hydroxy-5-deazaflavin:NADPH oxidoreductase